MTMDIQKYTDCFRLNCRVVRLALSNKWLTRAHFEKSYDGLAPDYNESWLKYLQPVTESLLAHLPDDVAGRIIDLGCGTGFTTKRLIEKYPRAEIVAVDLSAGMLEQARKALDGTPVVLIHEDMLAFLSKQADCSAAMIVSAWAIGYSEPDRLLREASRVLKPDGSFAFVVNCADTLKPIYLAFRKCMARYPQFLNHLAWPNFPKGWDDLGRVIATCNFRFTRRDEGRHPIRPQETNGSILPWLLRTGILAGFEHMLPLDTPGPVQDYFEQLMRANKDPVSHHFIAAVVQRT